MAGVRVKICGITSLDDARAAVEAGAWALGFNFYRGSLRYVEPAVAAAIAAALPRSTCTLGVFVDAPRESAARIAEDVGLWGLQFHGSETEDYCSGWARKVIKAVRMGDRAAVVLARRYDVDFILADAYVKGQPGGTGTCLDWSLLDGLECERLILAGGLTPDNVGAAVRAVRPFAVDVASGVEESPGKKDHERMRRFIAHAHAA